MKRIAITLAALVAALTLTGGGVALAAEGPIPDGAIPVVSDCNSGWYVPKDEEKLLPKQEADGFLFDGPSIVHRTIDPIPLSQVPDASFVATVETGSAPLIKLETSSNYSTINVVADGYWSSKIAADQPGGQSHPVAKAEDLIGKWSGYTDATRVVTLGIGYANDAGNKATVSRISFGEADWSLVCVPDEHQSSSASPSPSASHSSSASPKPSGSKASSAAAGVTTTSAPADAASLPVTGPGAGTWFLLGLLTFAAGLALLILYGLWRHKITITRDR